MLFDTTFVGRSSEDALAFIVEILQSSTEYFLIAKGLDGKIVLWNEGARRVYGYQADEILGTAAADILHFPEDIAARLPRVMMEESLRQGKWEGVLTRLRKNGQRFLARAAMTPGFDAAGKHTGFLLISKDITNDSALSEELSMRTGELRTTNERLSARVDLNLHLGSELDLQRLLQLRQRGVCQIAALHGSEPTLDPEYARPDAPHTERWKPLPGGGTQNLPGVSTGPGVACRG